MTFRSPLRIQWERDKPKYAQQAISTGDSAVIARALLSFMPPLIDFMEGELMRSTRPGMTLEAVTAAITNMAFQAISATVDKSDQRAALVIVHRLLERDVGSRLERGQTSGQIIMPGGLH